MNNNGIMFTAIISRLNVGGGGPYMFSPGRDPYRVYVCNICGDSRQFGHPGVPLNRTPMLLCCTCRTATRHTYH